MAGTEVRQGRGNLLTWGKRLVHGGTTRYALALLSRAVLDSLHHLTVADGDNLSLATTAGGAGGTL